MFDGEKHKALVVGGEKEFSCRHGVVVGLQIVLFSGFLLLSRGSARLWALRNLSKFKLQRPYSNILHTIY